MKTGVTPCYNGGFVTEFILSTLALIRVFFRSRSDTALEILALHSGMTTGFLSFSRLCFLTGWHLNGNSQDVAHHATGSAGRRVADLPGKARSDRPKYLSSSAAYLHLAAATHPIPHSVHR